MFYSNTVSSPNCNNSNAAGDAGMAPICSATAQQCRGEGAEVGRADPSKHLVELCEHGTYQESCPLGVLELSTFLKLTSI